MQLMFGALALALAALFVFVGALLFRHPSVPGIIKNEAVGFALAYFVTALLAFGVTLVAISFNNSLTWQVGLAAVIVIGATSFGIAMFRKVSGHWVLPTVPSTESPIPLRFDESKAKKHRRGRKIAA